VERLHQISHLAGNVVDPIIENVANMESDATTTTAVTLPTWLKMISLAADAMVATDKALGNAESANLGSDSGVAAEESSLQFGAPSNEASSSPKKELIAEKLIGETENVPFHEASDELKNSNASAFDFATNRSSNTQATAKMLLLPICAPVNIR